MKQVVMFSMWRDDANKFLPERVGHLLSKSYPALRYVWVVGDCQDDTAERLTVEVARYNRDVQIVRIDTGILGDDPLTRRRRLGTTANAWLDAMRPEDDYLLVHESDILSPVDIAERFLAHADAGRCPVAGWPILPISDNQAIFYDIFCYRKDGQMFSNYPPFHSCYRPDQPFEVDSFGTCWMMDAADVRAGARFGNDAVLTICRWLKEHGRHLWVDPTLTVIQPRELWVCHEVVP